MSSNQICDKRFSGIRRNVISGLTFLKNFDFIMLTKKEHPVLKKHDSKLFHFWFLEASIITWRLPIFCSEVNNEYSSLLFWFSALEKKEYYGWMNEASKLLYKRRKRWNDVKRLILILLNWYDSRKIVFILLALYRCDVTHRFVFLGNKKIFSQYWILDFCLVILHY